MKKLALIAFAALSVSAVSTSAFASGWCAVCETGDINVGAPQIQLTVLKDTSVIGKASGNMSRANNNLSSNTYGVDLRAASIQITALKDSDVAAKATGNESVAQNNLASNIGNPRIAMLLPGVKMENSPTDLFVTASLQPVRFNGTDLDPIGPALSTK